MATHSGVVKSGLEILQAFLNSTERIRALVGVGVDGEGGGSHRLGDLADLGKENVVVSKDEEHILAGLVASGRIDKGLGNVGVVHVQVATKKAPENALEGRNAIALNSCSDKPN